MLANYHAHTVRCRHAQGDEETYIQCAISRGFQIFGFSDHTPQFFPGDYYSHMRMYPEQLSDYCDTVRSLQNSYRGQLEIPLGLEVEYYPAIFHELIPRIQDQGIEYMILGQHWLENEMNSPYAGTLTEDESFLQRYCDQVIAAMDTGLFTYVAHPDIVGFVGDRRIYHKHMRRLCRAAKETNTPLEINFLGISEKRLYPNPQLWEIVAEEGCSVILGMDAHRPEHILDPEPEKLALSMVETYQLNLLKTVPFKKP